MFGTIGILSALIVLTIMLAAVFLVRSSITVGATGKILAFVGLCVLPVLCIGAGMSYHMQRSQQTAYCISCHSMESHGQSLYVLNVNYIPAQHFQNHLVPSDKACYTCHTDYTMYGPLKDKLKGLKYLYMEYVSTPPKTIHLIGTYSNSQCLHCHAGTRDFEANPSHMAPMGATNQISCIACHNTIHNVSEVAHLKMWTEGVVSSSVAAGAAPAATESAAAAGPSKAGAGSSASDATAAQGKAIFDSQGCGACHGASGGGGIGPALTHTSSQYSPAQLTAVLKTPTAQMTTAGMVPLTVNAADMKALVSYVTSLGATSAGPATAHPTAGSSSALPDIAQPGATPGPPKAASASAPPASGSPSPAPATAEPAAAAGPSKAGAESSASDATAAQGKAIFDSQRCGACHGESGGGGIGPALTHTSSQYSPAQLAAVLKTPTAQMTTAGMVPLTVNAADMEALVSYLTSLGGTSAAPVAHPTAGSPSALLAAAGPSKAGTESSASDATAAQGKAIFDSQRCGACHGESGGGGIGPALTHTSSQYSPAQLAAVLKTPTAQMTTAGMVPLTVNAADMEALVSYLTSLGGTSAAPVAHPTAGSPSVLLAAPSKPESKARSILRYLFMP